MSVMSELVEIRKIFLNDPVHLKSMINTEVEVETVHDSLVLRGILFTIDPVSETVVLINPTENSLKVTMVMDFNVKSVKTVDESNIPKIPDNLFKVEWAKFMSEEEVDRKRERLKQWILKHSIPIVEAEKVLKLDDVLSIEPPYGPDNVVSNNEIVLGKIQGLIKTVPE